MEADAGQDHAVWVSDDQPDQGARDVAPAGPGRPRHSSADMTDGGVRVQSGLLYH